MDNYYNDRHCYVLKNLVEIKLNLNFKIKVIIQLLM